VKLDSGLVLLGFVVWSLFFGLVMFYQGYGRGVVDENPQYPREPPRCQIIQTIVNNRGPCSCPSWESCGYSDWNPIVRDGRVIGCLSFENEMDILLEVLNGSG